MSCIIYKRNKARSIVQVVRSILDLFILPFCTVHTVQKRRAGPFVTLRPHVHVYLTHIGTVLFCWLVIEWFLFV